ncbi:DNA-binding protein [Sphingomonas koreensis]|uniref:helix-turn-helix domain-containing protein n=1 Tax=Sphingomonas koreensis TaxID=93064 RepID=UPI0008361343|nr:helix-turn-helix domain-containing protein [Sphingomonas koreensis]PJI87170.1 helix-turn-helix protein [Sphingomonas koreensis]RSU59614.1 DNA-binding protein [Sphingomonas koreensis]RSU68768.1 DNA-binding protein [Sphingomonas koreensis]
MTEPSDNAADIRAARARGGSPFLSPDQAAFYLGISSRTLQEYRTAGTGPRFRRHSRHLRYHIDDLDAWSQSLGEAGDDA